MGFLDGAGLAHLWAKIQEKINAKMSQTQADQRYLKLSGGTLTGSLFTSNGAAIVSNGIILVPDPSEPECAANRQYVDEAAAAKQDKLTGTAGQVVGFNAQGEAMAQAAPAVNLLDITFGEESKGKSYTIQSSTETYTNTVPDSLHVIAAVRSARANYTITCGSITETVQSGSFGPAKAVDMVRISCSIWIQLSEIPPGAAVKNVMIFGDSGQIETMMVGNYLYSATVTKPGGYYAMVITTSGPPVQSEPFIILKTDTSKDINITLG